ncbi:MAG: M36 family metallopeptidase [Acidobacteriota bacterium]
MKRTTLLIAALFFLGAFSLAISTFAERQSATNQRNAQRQRTTTQSGAASSLPVTRENFDIRAGRMMSLEATAETPSADEANAQASKPTFKRATATSKLERRLPGLQMKWSTLSQAPSRIWGFANMLTPPSSADPEAIARGFLKENNDLYQLRDDEVDNLRVARRYRTDHNGLTHITMGQQAGGFEVFQADLTVHVDDRGAVIAASGELIAGASRKASAIQPKMTAAEALQLAARDVDEAITGALNLSETPRGVERRQKFARDAGFGNDVQARLVYFPLAADALRLSWEFILPMRETPDVYLLVVDAERGTVLFRYNFTCYDENPLRPHGQVYVKDSPRPGALPFTGNANPPIVPREDLPFRAAPYNGREIFAVSNPHYDWWAGVPASGLIGNNVDAHLDRDATPNQPDLPRLAAADGNFSFPVDFAQAPTTADNQHVAQVNLFYWVNRYHDILYSFGFNEAAGNFQTNNFGLGGLGNDAVLADAQDGGGTNNANFSSPPDGNPGRMQMYLWTTGNPQIDGDLDQTVVLHELTHGLTQRLNFNSTGLVGLQSGGMGEGWSDWFSLVLSRTESDNLQGTYPHGQYATNNYPIGIRRFPYSNNPQVFPLTYKDVAQLNQVHAIGEIWCNTLLEMRTLLINKYGFQEGQRQSLQLVVDALKLTPRGPSFLDARNAILLADRVNNQSANQCLIWQAFAKRGAGFTAASVDSNDGAPEESLLTAPYCSDFGSIRFNKSSYVAGETVRFWLSDRNATGTLRAMLTSSVTGDQETVTLAPEMGVPGSFIGTFKLATGRARAGDNLLQGSAELGDQIVVSYTDANNGSTSSALRASAAFVREKILFDDTIENGNQGWLPSGTWAVTNARAASPLRSWTDSPAGQYTISSDSSLTSPLLDFSGMTEVSLSFSQSYDLEQSFDFGTVEFSTDDGATWKRLVSFTGTQTGFAQAQVRLRALDGQARARVRFRLTTDTLVNADGWYLDDIRFTGRSVSASVIEPDSTAPPVIGGISPAFGPPGGGTRVTIFGANFTETDDTSVSFDNVPASSVAVVSGSVITAIAPAHAAGAATVRLTNRNGAVSLVKGFTYFVAGSSPGAPVIGSLYPSFGSIRGGTVVTLVGSNFTPETAVSFGAARGAATYINANTLRVVTPAATALGASDVNVANGTAQTRLTGGFNYIDPTPPTVGSVTPSGETLFAGTTVSLRWRSSDNRAVARHAISFRRNTSTGTTLVDIAPSVEGATQTYAWTVPASFAGFEGRIRIVAVDDEGSETEAFSDANLTIVRRWEPSTSLPFNSVIFFATAGDSRYLYALGGRNLATADVAASIAGRLDTTASAPVWTEIAPLPTPLSSTDAVFLKGKIYVPGGVTLNNVLSRQHLAYDVATNAWATVADVPVASTNYALAADDARGVFYYTSGITVRSYDPVANVWANLPSMGTGRVSHEAALIEGRLYVAGGTGPGGAIASAEVFDVNTRLWSPIAPLNRARTGAVNFVGKSVAGTPLWFVIGGQDTSNNTVPPPEVYDVANNRWIVLDGSFNLNTPRALANGAVVGNLFYVVGGAVPLGANLVINATNERTRIDLPITVIPLNPTATALAVPATQIAVAGIETRFGVTANDLGSGVPITLTARDLPPGAAFNTSAETNNSVRGAFHWTPSAADTGKTFAVSFTASDGQFSDTKLVNIRVVEAGGLAAVNSADFRIGPIAPGSLASIFGTNLAVRTEAAPTAPLPFELAGTTVSVNGVPAPLVAVSPSQVNFVVPPGAEIGTATIIVSNPAGTYAAGTVEIALSAPALFTRNSAGTGDAFALATVDGVNYQTPPFDVVVGGRSNILVLSGTGFRRAQAANPNDDNGVAESVTATIGGRPARVLFAGAQGDFTGLDQINVELPPSLAGGGPRSVEVVLSVNGVTANRVTIQIK